VSTRSELEDVYQDSRVSYDLLGYIHDGRVDMHTGLSLKMHGRMKSPSASAFPSGASQATLLQGCLVYKKAPTPRTLR